jgi:hypothetical protein
MDRPSTQYRNMTIKNTEKMIKVSLNNIVVQFIHETHKDIFINNEIFYNIFINNEIFIIC